MLRVDADHLLDGLDPAQRTAVTSEAQPLAILAGPGSGKTRVLTRRIAHRCATGAADPRHVLAVTFTRKAAAELDSRLRGLGLRDLPTTGTFHALAYAQLRAAWAADHRSAPTLLDSKGRMLARILGSTRRVRPSDLAAEIEWAKARLVTPDAYPDAVATARRAVPVDAERVAGWYRRYEDDKKRRGMVDFDDLLLLATARLERDPSFAAAQRWRFRHLFVDEFQDVNPLQHRLLRAWLGDSTDLCVVGDPNQAIYSWNGADASFLVDFAVHHPGGSVVQLRDSYRSTPQVLGVAAAVLGTPEIGAHRPDGPAPVVVGYQTDVDEANGVARAVRDHHRPGRPWSAQAVLVRTNAQATLFAEAFRRAAIPHRVRGADRLVDDPDVRDLLRRFSRLHEPLLTTINDLDASLVRQRADLLDAIGSTAGDGGASASRVELAPSAAGKRLDAFEQVVRLGRELLALEPAARTDSFPAWLHAVLVDDAPDAGDAVTIASFHAAKGLEWDVVHVAGVEAGYVPISHARTPEARAEEERLFYVAVTRAARVLRCSWARTRTFASDPVERAPSPLLARVREAVGAMERAAQASSDATPAISHGRADLAAGPHDPDTARSRAIVADLHAWRDDQARKAAVRPTVVLSDRAVHALARRRPASPDELADVPGLGVLARERHGARLLAIVAAHLDAAPAGR